jgi:acyl-CoA synthetase (AMP-forming)/AMP-acid ligase II
MVSSFPLVCEEGSVTSHGLGHPPSAELIVCDVVTRGRDFYGDRLALVGASGARSYRALAQRVESLAAVLVDEGLEPGARLALLAPNGPEFVEVLLAASRIGAAVVPLNHRLVGPEVAYQVDDADAALALVHPRFADLAESAGLFARPYLLLDDDLERRLARTPAYAGPRPDPTAVLIQLYTSGTTGRPKGCMLTQRNWTAAATSFAHAYDLHAADVVLTALPLFHVAAMSWTVATLLAGGTVVLPEQFDPAAFWSTVAEFGVTVAAAPFGVRPALKHPDARVAGRSLRMMVGVPSRLADDVLPHVDMVSGYGATELCGQVTAIRGPEQRTRPDSIGRLMAGCTAAIVGDDGSPVPPGTTGELVVRGPGLTAGYWRLPEATTELLRDGWVHTGDLVRADDEGYLYFVDRAKDMIKTGGENVYPAEVEAVLLAHPAVRDVAVFGVADERWGQSVKAVVVPSGAVTPADLDAWCLERLAPYKRPRWYETAGVLPRNASGKVLKPLLRDAHDPATAARLSER